MNGRGGNQATRQQSVSDIVGYIRRDVVGRKQNILARVLPAYFGTLRNFGNDFGKERNLREHYGFWLELWTIGFGWELDCLDWSFYLDCIRYIL